MIKVSPLLVVTLLLALRGWAQNPNPTQGTPDPVPRFTAESGHYRVTSEVGERHARETVALLERAWPSWKARFGSEPDPAEFGLLEVNVFTHHGRFARAVKDSIDVHVGQTKGRCDWKSGRVWVLHAALPEEARSLILHEATHQFQFLTLPAETRRGRTDPLPFWYSEGTAHDCERHTVDGQVLELACARSAHTGEFAQWALLGTAQPFWRMDAYLELGGYARGVQERPMGWALVRFFRHADDGKYRGAFERLEGMFARRENRRGFIESTPWTEKELERAFIAWLKSQVPRQGTIRGEWRSTADGVEASVEPGAFALQLRDAGWRPGDLTTIGFTTSRELRGLDQVGFVVGYTSPLDYTLVYFAPRFGLVASPRVAGVWQKSEVHELPAAPKAGSRVTARLDRTGKLEIAFGEATAVGTVEAISGGLPAGSVGLYCGASGHPEGPRPLPWRPRTFLFGAPTVSVE